MTNAVVCAYVQMAHGHKGNSRVILPSSRCLGTQELLFWCLSITNYLCNVGGNA